MRAIDADKVKIIYRGGFHDDYVVDYNSFINAPTIDIPTWIPCSEKLPSEEKASYLICTDSGYMCECRWTDANPFWTHLKTDWHWNMADIPRYSKVIAWMPLLKPYREDGE